MPKKYTQGESHALILAKKYGQADEARRKAWAIDQMCRAILGGDYEQYVITCKGESEVIGAYEWDVGIGPCG